MTYHEKTERWFTVATEFSEEMNTYWGDWGVCSEFEQLRAVLLRRPGAEIEDMEDPSKWRWVDTMDPQLARAQHDEMAWVYREEAGAEVYYVDDMREDRPNAMFMRDLMFMTPEGAIVGRPAIACRRGEEKFVAKKLAELGVPIVRTITGTGVFEGACAMWVDRETVILGTGVRCNREGARQVKEVLERMGVEVIPFQIPYAHAHVDGLLNILDRDLALMFPWQTPHDVWEALRERGIEVLETPTVEEAKSGGAVNFVALEPRKILMASGNTRTKAMLEDRGVEVREIDISELRKGWGGLHCMTAFLKRGE
jgi:N-dimethylarginine dimethylaminohydrolase